MSRIIRLFQVFLLWTATGLVGKCLFLLVHHDMLGITSFTECFDVMYHGLPLDFAIAGYLTLLPALMLIVSVWYRGKALQRLSKAYFALTALLSSVAYIVNIGLYAYWGFPLDSTPLLYLKTSPADAMASVTLWQTLGGLAAITVFTAVMTRSFWQLDIIRTTPRRKLPAYVEVPLLTVLSALLIIPIRGGVSTGTNHTGTVYFSGNMRMNHAAVNPLFCFIESVNHLQDIGGRYRFMDDAEATQLFSTMTYTSERTAETDILLDSLSRQPNVVIILLESFSKYIMQEAGHVSGVTPCLEKAAAEGVYFTRFYASSFRTDRALVSILSGLPAQPTMSIMDMPGKSNSLPSIAGALRDVGYATTFYYGGDADYSNMRSYFMGTGFETIVSEDNFPSKLRTGKWGVADGPLFQRMLSDITSYDGKKPTLRVIMTGSSHEPFDVPDHNVLPSPELNAFHYADECLGRFLEGLRKSPSWNNTLVVILPDHLGACPTTIDNYALWRYELPLILTGGAVRCPRHIDTICCQTDLPATLLALLGVPHDDFLFSRDALDPAAPHFAFFTLDDGMGIVTSSSAMIYDNHARRMVFSQGEKCDSIEKNAKAYLQKLYDYIDGIDK